jgi:hypothetical protein
MEHISQLRIERWDVQVLPGLDSGGHIRELHTGRYELGPKASRIPTVLILTQLEEVMISSTANFQTALTAFKNGQLIFLVTIAGYSRVFTNYPTGVGGQYDWIESVDDINQTIQAIEGGADQTSWGFTVQDKTGLVTADFPGFTFEGKQVTVQVGFVGLAQVDFCTIFTGIVDTVANANSNNSYYFTCLDISAKLAQVVYVTGDDGINPVSSKNLKTINGHPLDILLDILSNKIGLPGGQIDTTKIQAYRDGPFSGVQFTFRLSQSVTAHDFNSSTPIGIVGLMGAFTDGAGVVKGSPLAIGLGGTFVVPAGATQLQLGINDNIPNDNQGSFAVSVVPLLAAANPTFVEIDSSTFMPGQTLRASTMLTLMKNIRAALLLPEIFGPTSYTDGQTITLPTSPLDGYVYSLAECTFLWDWVNTGPSSVGYRMVMSTASVDASGVVHLTNYRFPGSASTYSAIHNGTVRVIIFAKRNHVYTTPVAPPAQPVTGTTPDDSSGAITVNGV